MRTIITLAAAAVALALAGFPSVGAAGIELRFEGTARSEATARAALDEAAAFAKARGWAVQREPSAAVLFPHAWCEPVELVFEERTLVPGSVKTQFAGSQVHAEIVALLRALQPRFEKLQVEDEGEYWPDANGPRLEARFREETAAIERVKATQPGAKGPVWAVGGALVDFVSGDLPPQARFDGPPRAVEPPAGWHHVTAPDAGFSVLMPPGEPKRLATTVDGLPYFTHSHSDPSTGLRFLVLTWDWGRNVDPRALEFARGQVLGQTSGTVVRERIANRRGALELEIERVGGKGRMAVLLAQSGHRAYQVQVEQDAPGPLPAPARAFLGSFRPRVTEPPAQPPPQKPVVKVQPVEPAAPSTGWRRHEARGEGFAVDLPGLPHQEVLPDGDAVTWTWMAPAGAPIFTVTVWRLPDAARAENGVAILADTITSSVPGAVARGPATVGQGLAARAIVVEDDKLRGELRVFAEGPRLFRLAIVADGRTPHPDDVRRFFTSFAPVADRVDGPASSAAGAPERR